MDLPVVLLLFLLYTVVVGAGALVYFLLRRKRVTDGGLPIPNTAGLTLTPLSQRTPFKWENAESRASETAPTLDHASLAPVSITPGSYAPINISPVTAAAPPAPRVFEPEPAPIRFVNPPILEDHTDIEVSLPEPTALTRALADIFGTRGPLLPEGMRTLQVSPSRTIEPGARVRATFVFQNLGGGAASGFRVRFRLPEGLAYEPASALIDQTPLDDTGLTTALLHEDGADIGEVPAGSERHISLSFRVAGAVENGTVIALQAALASAEVPAIGSNIVRLVVRSAPLLQNSQTTLALKPLRQVLPGEELQLVARVHNSGQSSAHDVVILLPLPANTSYSPNSATIDGNYAGISDRVPFGFAQPMIVAPVLAPGTTIEVGYRVRISTPLEDGTPIAVQGAVCAEEIAEFALPPVVVNVPSAASFASPETTFSIDCASGDVEAGKHVRFVLRAKNAGTAAARKLSLAVALPEGMLYTPGSVSIDGAPAADDGTIPEAFVVGDLEPGHAVDLALSAIVRSPIANGRELRATAAVRWTKGQREFERTITARSAPRFPADFNKLESDIARHVTPGEWLTYSIALHNMGTDVATDVRVALAAGDGLQNLRILEGDSQVALTDNSMVAVGALEPGVGRTLRVEAQVAPVIEDQAELYLTATLSSAQVAQIDLGTRVHLVESRPLFTLTRSALAFEGDGDLRFKEACWLRLSLTNEGSDRGRDVRVVPALPDEVRLEEVEGDASRDGKSIAFGDIAAGETRVARLRIRLVGTLAGGEPLSIGARVSGRNVVPFGLRPIELATEAGANFSEGATLTTSAADTIDAGAELEYTLTLRNSGEGMAKRLTARIVALSNAVYAQGSTRINDIALADQAGTSVLLGESGLRLANVGSGVEVIARWRVIVNMPLPPTAIVETTVSISADDTPEFSIVATPVGVRSMSALPITDPNLPFAIIGAIAAPTRPAPPAIARLAAGLTRLNGIGRAPEIVIDDFDAAKFATPVDRIAEPAEAATEA